MQGRHDERNQEQLQQDAQNSVTECTCEKQLPGEWSIDHAKLYALHNAPYDSTGQHGGNQTAVKGTHALPSGYLIKIAENKTVSH